MDSKIGIMRRVFLRLIVGVIAMIFQVHKVNANNLVFSQLVVEDDSHLNFTVSWDNSWTEHNHLNHDAVWVFVKYQVNGSEWRSLKLSPVSENHSTTDSGLEVLGVEDSMGVFIKQKSTGNSTFIVSANFRIGLAQPLNQGSYSFQLFGIEMVYIAEGDFLLGDGISNHTFKDSLSGAPISVQNNPTPLGIGNNQLWTGFSNSIQQIPASYPSGWKAFYCMKYEISQSQYMTFLNCLTLAQQTTRIVMPPTSPAGTFCMNSTGNLANRNSLVISQSSDGINPAQFACNLNTTNGFNEWDDGQNLAMNFLSWSDLVAYLDWSGLRPITEMEFEKICSEGVDKVIPLGFAWGTAFSVDGNTLQLDGTPAETVQEIANDTAGLANHGYSGVQGPLRCGFGANQSNLRLQAGASVTGVMELSGNLWELCVATNDFGFQFGTLSGDGKLDEQGQADQAFWYPNAENAIYRGGAWLSGVTGSFRDLAVADRFYLNLRPSFRRNTTGGRGGRSVTW